ncbi:MAG: hypothetical protein AAB448_03130 [Patescibacteria group bacterium]
MQYGDSSMQTSLRDGEQASDAFGRMDEAKRGGGNDGRIRDLYGNTFSKAELETYLAELEEMRQAAADNRQKFGYGSENNVVAQYPLGSPLPGAMDTNAIDPNNFSYIQQQARMAEGVDAPSLLPDDVAALPDPEYSTDEEPVTYRESLGALQQQAREAEDIEGAQSISQNIRNKINQASDQAAEEMKKLMKEKTSRWVAKGAGNGGNALDSVGWDAWIVFACTYLYLMARGVVSVLSPESQPSTGAQKMLHTVFPPYRPLREPGDFLYFLFVCVISVIIVCVVIAVLVAIMNLFLFPFFTLNGFI